MGLKGSWGTKQFSLRPVMREEKHELGHRVHRVESQLGVSPANIDTGEAGGGYLRQRVTKIACGHFGSVRVIFGRANTA